MDIRRRLTKWKEDQKFNKFATTLMSVHQFITSSLHLKGSLGTSEIKFNNTVTVVTVNTDKGVNCNVMRNSVCFGVIYALPDSVTVVNGSGKTLSEFPGEITTEQLGFYLHLLAPDII